tara:strand:- start:7118 stop:8359 length:1242 start_codon:yes stop_codon:yes gene_type:complete
MIYITIEQLRKYQGIDMSRAKYNVLTINGGSSSIKFALYGVGATMQAALRGKIDRIGLSGTTFSFSDSFSYQQDSHGIEVADYSDAANFLLDWLAQKRDFSQISAVGHRVVHGMKHTEPEIISQSLLDDLRRYISFDPDHLPGEIDLIERFRTRYPQLPQVACFDTAFHQTLPRVAKLLPIPRRFDAMGIQRYGFHGLSYAFLMQALEQLAGKRVAQGRVILAHLGNGASLAAVRNGQSIDTSMGFTPSGGIPMGTRSGDLDPGVVEFMMQHEQLTTAQIKHLVNHESGLLGVSETSSDMRDLIKYESTDNRAAEAVELFCYQVKKHIGAYSAALSGLDTLVFAGGIGENAATVRARICSGLEFLGIEIEDQNNANNAEIISTKNSRVTVRVMHTDEELMLATTVCRVLNLAN